MGKGGTSDGARRFPVGVVVAIAVVALAGWGAYWFLDEYGVIGDPTPETSLSSEAAEAGDDDDRPEWLQGTSFELPLLTEPENDLEPAARVLEEWVWELVDGDWSLTVVREGEGDGSTSLSDYQALYLVSPTEDLFKISDLRTDFDMNLVHWDSALQVAWLERGGRSDLEQVIEYDLIALESTEDFLGNVVSSTNLADGGVVNIEYRADMGDDRELWVSFDPAGYATGVFWRDGAEWEQSLISDQIRRMAQQGLSRERGVDAWIDPATERAVYHGVFIDPDTQRLADEMWVVHDLATEEFDDTVVVAVPSDDCRPVDGPRSGVFEGDRIVALCGETEHLLDPYGNEAPVER